MSATRIFTLLMAGLLAGLMLWPATGQAQAPYAQTPFAWTETDAAGQTRVQLYFFWSKRCPHCLEAKPSIEALPAQHPWIRLHSLEISQSRENLQRYVAMAAALDQTAQSVPALLFCGRMQVGWHSEESTGADLIRQLTACRDQAAAGAAPAPLNLPDTRVQIPLIGSIDAASLSLPVLTLVIAGMDAFNPCAFFVLLFLLSLLVHQQDRRRMLLIGGVFVFFSGFMYFAFMAAWLGLFRVMGSLPWVTLAAGLVALVIGALNVKDFFAFRHGPSLSIPEASKPGIYRRARAILVAGTLPAMLAATVTLAVAANFYELLCTAGFPMVYTRLLTLTPISHTHQLAYLALYNVIYVLPLLVIVLAFVRTMGARKLSEREGRLLKLLSGLMMLGLGALLLLAPERLGHLGVALGLMLAAAGLTWLIARIRPD